MPRQRGAQPGNTNAVRHGFYSRARLTARTLALLDEAREHGDLRDDIALMRAEIAHHMEAGDYDPKLIALICGAIVKATVAQERIARESDTANQFERAVENLLADLQMERDDAA